MTEIEGSGFPRIRPQTHKIEGGIRSSSRRRNSAGPRIDLLT
jgi:hypothetical protein